MLPPDQIIVAVKDPWQRGTPAAVRKAAQLARSFGARLELFHALTAPLQLDVVTLRNISVRQYQHEQRTGALQQLDKLARRIAQRGVDTSTHVEIDSPAFEATIRRARKIGAGLIVADTHHGRHLPVLRLQFTDWELLRHSPIPVLLVRNTRRYYRPGVLVAIDPSHAFAKTDRLDQDILEAGATFSKALRGTLHAVHSYVPLPVPVKPAELQSRGIEVDLQEMTMKSAARRFAEALRNARIPPARRHLSPERPDVAIARVAAREHSGIVVMGALSRSGLRRLFFGNTAERALDELPCDTLIVKPRKFDSRVMKKRRGVGVVTTSLPMGI